jgi:co-chaperonin GroES (HSP10)
MQLTPELEDVRNRVRVLRDRVLVKPLPFVHPTLLTPGIEIQKGVVIAVGYGRRKRRKVEFRQSLLTSGKTLFFEDGEETGEIVPMDIAPGDVIEFSFRNLTIVDFDRIGFPGIGDLVFVWRQSIYSVDPDESLNECLLWQQSAGYDRHGNYMSGSEDWHRA